MAIERTVLLKMFEYAQFHGVERGSIPNVCSSIVLPLFYYKSFQSNFSLLLHEKFCSPGLAMSSLVVQLVTIRILVAAPSLRVDSCLVSFVIFRALLASLLQF